MTGTRRIGGECFWGITLVLLMLSGGNPSEATSRPKVWVQVYQELNGGENPTWTNHQQAEEWVGQNADRLEPVVLSILRGEREDIFWTAGLAIAGIMPTVKIRAAVQGMLSDMTRDASRIQPGSANELGLVSMIDILSMHPTPQFLSDVRVLVLRQAQNKSVVEHCMKALRRVGTRDDLETMQQVPARQDDKAIDQLAKLTERIIEDRASGREPLGDAPDQLRALTRAWVDAIERKDYEAYLKVYPSGGRAGFTRGDYFDELLPSPELPAILQAVNAGIDEATFEVDPEKLEGKLVIDGRYEFRFVLEVDGWKTGGPTLAAP